jgi:hypothetical protein
VRAIQLSWWYHRPVLYRVFDADDRLIYVGASHVLHFRMQTHEARSWWYGLARRVAWEFHPTKESAFAAESVALQEEQPVFNVRGTGRAEDDFSHWTTEDARACEQWVREDLLRASGMGVQTREFLGVSPDIQRAVHEAWTAWRTAA